jgi:hypothetical protein
MKTISRLSLIAAMAVGGAGVVGCEETVSKTEETKVRSDGSSRTETETVKKEADGTVKKETTMEKTSPAP